MFCPRKSWCRNQLFVDTLRDDDMRHVRSGNVLRKLITELRYVNTLKQGLPGTEQNWRNGQMHLIDKPGTKILLRRIRPFPSRGGSCLIHLQLACICRRALPLLDVYRCRHQHGLPPLAYSQVVPGAVSSRVFFCCLRHADARRWADFLGCNASNSPSEIRSAWGSALAA